MRRPDIQPTAHFKSKFRREPGSRHEVFSTNTVDGVSLRGAMGAGYLNGAYVYLFEFEGGGDEYRWIFNDAIPDRSMSIITAGLRHDPSYRDQFKKPAVPAKEVDADALGELLSRAFGEHSIVSSGSIEPGPHSWESRLRIVLAEAIPAPFATFARKCPYLTLSKALRQDCITVTSPLGNASQANLLLIKAIEDFANGSLGSQADYKLVANKINTWPTKPEIISSKAKPEAQVSNVSTAPVPELTLAQKIERIINTDNPKAKLRELLFLKAGRDEFSAMKLEALESRIDPDDINQIYKHFSKPDDRLKSMRWLLRGLPTLGALAKVEVDNESTKKLLERKKDYSRFDDDSWSHSR